MECVRLLMYFIYTYWWKQHVIKSICTGNEVVVICLTLTTWRINANEFMNYTWTQCWTSGASTLSVNENSMQYFESILECRLVFSSYGSNIISNLDFQGISYQKIWYFDLWYKICNIRFNPLRLYRIVNEAFKKLYLT